MNNSYRKYSFGYCRERVSVYSKILGVKPKLTNNSALFDLGENGTVEVDFFSERDPI